MSDGLLAQPDSAPQGLLAQRAGKTISKKQARSAFWRMVALTWPHRRPLVLGLVLGLGVALTYAASLGGILPVLKVVVDKQDLHTWLLDKAASASKHGHAWAEPLLATIAGWFPADTLNGEPTPASRYTSLKIILLALLGANLLGNALRCVSQYLVLYASNRAIMDLRRRMYRKALHVPMNQLTGDVSNRVSQIMSDVREVYLGIVTLFGKVAREPLKAVCVLAVAIAIDVRLTLLVLAIAPVAVGLLWYFGRRVRKATVRLLQGYGVMLGGLEESLQGIDTVKGYAREGYERRRMWQLERKMLKHQNRLAWVESFSSPLIEVVGVAIASGGILWLGQRTFSGEIDASQFGVMVVLLTAMLDPIRKIANVYNMVQRAGAASTRIFEFLDQPDEQTIQQPARLAVLPTSMEATRVAGREVTFEHITFRYNPDAAPALNDVSLRVAPGECIALVGPNGSGKSTLLKLLPRLLETDAGQVKVDGFDVRDLSLRALRREVTYVTQRPVIFARSVHENIAYGRDDATPELVQGAARHAFAAEFIESWPKQYETLLGEFGTSVSGGQRQRIALARAFLKPASILIFDEATSEIDAESEGKIHAALHELRRGKTTFLIAHRHTVMDMADRIVVMDNGQIVDVGGRDELLARCPLFIALYRSPSA